VNQVRHIFVETNWLFAVAAPAHDRIPAALELLDSARDGRVRIYVPSCCIGEARKTIRQKLQPKEADRLRRFVQWAVEQRHLDHETAESARTMLASFEGRVASELAGLNNTLRDVTSAVGVEVVHLDGAVLDMSLDLHFREVELSEFDRAVLAVVLVKGKSLRDGGEADVSFCELDSKLWPRDKRNRPRAELEKLYSDAGVRVYSDFTLQGP
jgi:predicted nucleic acid-binding protein